MGGGKNICNSEGLGDKTDSGPYDGKGLKYYNSGKLTIGYSQYGLLHIINNTNWVFLNCCILI